MFRSIRWRLVLSYLFLVALTLGVVGAIVLRLVEEYVERQEFEALSANAEAVARQAQGLMWPVALESDLRELAETSSFLGNARVRILDENLQVLADSERTQGFTWVLLPGEWEYELPEGLASPYMFEFPATGQVIIPYSRQMPSRLFERLSPEAAVTILRWQDGAWGGGFQFDVVQDREQLEALVVGANPPRSGTVISFPVGSVDSPLGYVEVSGGPDLVTEALATTRRAFLFAAAGAMLLAVLVGLVVSRGLTNPLRKLTAAAEQMGGGDLSIRAPVKGRDEIGRLAGQFNLMAGRLEANFAELAAERDALRRFVADASHELRTPITALQSFNELLQGAAAADPAARAEFLAESGVQLDRLEGVTRSLLDLSRLDGGLVVLDLAEQDVGDLIEAAAAAFRRQARDKGIEFSVQAPQPPLTLRCDRARLEMALSNLLDNAVKFTPPGGQVTIGAELAAEAVHLWVRDTGPGIAGEEQPHLFERFYHGDSAAAGNGLGLAIVQSIAQAHGGCVRVESEAGAGSLFIVDLPRG
jgi:signal transduction histidine kinase